MPRLPRGSVLKYYLYMSTKAVGFYRPIMFLYFLSQGLSFTQVAILEGIYSTTTLFGEIPTGYVGDRVGRRNSLLIGTALITVTLVGIGFGGSFLTLALLYFCWSMGYNFRSGSDDAWLYDVLTEQGRSDGFAHVRGRGFAAALVVGAFGSVLGGYVGQVNLSYPFFIAACVTALGIPVLLTMSEPEEYRETDSNQLSIRRTARIISSTVRRPSLRVFLLYHFVLFAAVLSIVFMLTQPAIEAVARQTGIPDTFVKPLLGWLYAVVSILSAALSYHTGAIKEYIGLRRWFLVIPVVVGVTLAGILVTPLLAIPAFLLTHSISSTTRSLAQQYVNDRIDTLGRATVLSAMAMVSSLAALPFQLTSGYLSDLLSPLTTLALTGGLLVVGALVIMFWRSPVEVGHSTVDHADD